MRRATFFSLVEVEDSVGGQACMCLSRDHNSPTGRRCYAGPKVGLQQDHLAEFDEILHRDTAQMQEVLSVQQDPGATHP